MQRIPQHRTLGKFPFHVLKFYSFLHATLYVKTYEKSIKELLMESIEILHVAWKTDDFSQKILVKFCQTLSNAFEITCI